MAKTQAELEKLARDLRQRLNDVEQGVGLFYTLTATLPFKELYEFFDRIEQEIKTNQLLVPHQAKLRKKLDEQRKLITLVHTMNADIEAWVADVSGIDMKAVFNMIRAGGAPKPGGRPNPA